MFTRNNLRRAQKMEMLYAGEDMRLMFRMGSRF